MTLTRIITFILSVLIWSAPLQSTFANDVDYEHQKLLRELGEKERALSVYIRNTNNYLENLHRKPENSQAKDEAIEAIDALLIELEAEHAEAKKSLDQAVDNKPPGYFLRGLNRVSKMIVVMTLTYVGFDLIHKALKNNNKFVLKYISTISTSIIAKYGAGSATAILAAKVIFVIAAGSALTYGIYQLEESTDGILGIKWLGHKLGDGAWFAKEFILRLVQK